MVSFFLALPFMLDPPHFINHPQVIMFMGGIVCLPFTNQCLDYWLSHITLYTYIYTYVCMYTYIYICNYIYSIYIYIDLGRKKNWNHPQMLSLLLRLMLCHSQPSCRHREAIGWSPCPVARPFLVPEFFRREFRRDNTCGLEVSWYNIYDSLWFMVCIYT